MGFLIGKFSKTFYGGLSPQSKTSLDAGAGGPIMNKREDEVESIKEDVVRNYEDWYEGEREATSSKGTIQSVEQTNAITNLSNQMAKMAKQMEEFMKSRLEVEDESSRENEILEGSVGKNERGEKEKEKEPEKESTKDQTSLSLNLQPRNERLPFPQRFARSRLDVQFGKFLDVVKSLHVSIPFVDAMKEMPHYSKFLKDLLNGRREVETVSLTANCSSILSSKLPTKLQDPGSFSIPCSINEVHLGKALCDLGASVSLMPFSVYQKLNVGNLSPTNITLQLADRSTKLPIGKVEDIPLELVMRQPSSSNECFRIDTIENLMNEFRYPHMHASNDLLENVLLNENEVGDQKEMQLYEEMLDEKEETTPDQEMLQPYEVFQVEEEEISNGKVAPKVELKPLPSGLRYVFLDANDTFPVIVNANLTEEQTSSLLNVLKKHRKALVILLMISRV
ncbi:uncharacterized protein LOC110720274 [Chenopodium quinoa]|uniref:uncharacterized protein LOC110720274 n=1 Tax=Chenopodium quinoa TaxID=63459 RepID=UPI000B795EE8|nr:uncharacterized protein LOC110720274 [Chenopodium quinoa]